MILVKTFYAYNDLRNFSYLILDKNSGHSWVIDPYEAGPIENYIKKNGIELKGILNTHQHFDHIRGNAPLVDAFHAPVRKLKDSETVELGDGHSLQTLDTPGHTLDHQVFLWTKNSNPFALFSGDTLFNSGVGNCKNGGDVRLLYDTTEKLAKLPGGTLLYPGHDYRRRNLQFALSVEPENDLIKEKLRELESVKTEDLAPVNLEEEQKVNPFFRLTSTEILENVLHDRNGNKRELFIQLRKLRDIW